MGQAPRDPDQLARDILAGRVSIQELAREQARRRAAAQGIQPPAIQPAQQRAMPQQQGPARVPGGNVGPQKRAMPQQRTVRLPPPVNKPIQRPATVTAPVSPVVKTSHSAIDPYAAGAITSPAPAAKAAIPSPTRSGQKSPPTVPRNVQQILRKVLTNRQSVRTIFLASEILNKPLALRLDTLDRF